jgi:Glutamate decarboxylase and related PLP-dependent proteins
MSLRTNHHIRYTFLPDPIFIYYCKVKNADQLNFDLIFPGHPMFMNQLSCGLDVVSMAGEWLIATANTNMFTYEIAPVFILMETVVLEKMRQIIGWQGGDSILAPGLC